MIHDEPRKPKVLILSVGGTKEPLVTAITHHAPEFVCFLASQATVDTATAVKETVRDNGKSVVYEAVLVDNENDLLDCYRKALDVVGRIAARGYGKDDVVVDYTGATKNMSVALALAAISRGYAFSYVGGDKRTKNGVGIVETGHERIYASVNPWDFMAVEEKRQAVLLFNTCQYKACRDLLIGLSEKATKRKTLYRKLAFVVDAFYQWDLFRHQEALDTFKRGRLEDLADDDDPKVAEFAAACRQILPYIEKIIDCSGKGKKPCRELSHDLFANAERRFAEGKIDDAILRLYRLVEMLAQERLLDAYGIDTADVRPDRIPEKIRDEFVRVYTVGIDGKIMLPQHAAYVLLAELGDDLGLSYGANESRFRGVQSARNSSYLAHGFNSSKEKTYEGLKGFVIELKAIDPQVATTFPKMDL
jgi:CRISPR-associated protein (TIGR02710 family)